MAVAIGEMLRSYEVSKRSAGLSEDTIERVLLNSHMYSRDTRTQRTGHITTESIVGWGESKLRTGVAHSTVSTYYNSLRSFLRHIESTGIELAIDYSKISCKPQYGRRVALKPNEIKRIIRFADTQTQILTRTMYTSGMRISEAVSLTAADLTDTTLFIRGKGKKVRPVFITGEILDTLTAMAYLNGGDCFVDQYGERLCRKKAYYRIKKAMCDAGYPHASPHSLRHGFATDLLRNGANLSQVQKMMGHSSPQITQIYEHLITEDIEKTHKLLTPV